MGQNHDLPDVSEATIKDLQRRMSRGETSSRELVKAYLDRIARYDKAGPCLNSFLEVNPDAMFIAEAMDLERARRGPRGPLHGIPVVLKDNIDTADKMHTSAGSLALADSFASKDSFVAERLREAGAVILGKSNMTEWANFMTQGMPNGYSSRGGQVLNPYGPGRLDVGGSSSGSGAAVAASLVAAGVGTETHGSILSPSASNGLVGVKPTVGLISRSGVIPISPVQDTPGPMTRCVEDAAILLGALAGPDERDPATWRSEGFYHKDYTRFLDRDGLKGKRIGIPRDDYGRLDKERAALVEAAEEALKDLGATVVDMSSDRPKGWASRSLTYEFKPAINAYLSGLAPHVPVHSLKELIEFNRQRPYEMLRYGQTTFLAAEATSGTLTEPEYIRLRAEDDRLSREEGIDYLLGKYDLDALVYPGIGCTTLSAKSGYPAITVPVGVTSDFRPVAITFTSKAWSEPLLLAMAYALEEATPFRKPPALD
jgi:amidase